jgi:hypothetical protein
VRVGSGAGIGQKPDDWRTVSLCRDCHALQHKTGERTFWENYRKEHGCTVEELISAYCKDSPKAREITDAKRERGL